MFHAHKRSVHYGSFFQSAKRTKFLPEDDQRLKGIVARFTFSREKDIDWNVVAAEMGTKTARQCRERYKNYLSPSLSNGAWTQKEEELLTQKYEEYGPKWAKMTPFFPGRSDVNIKNHWSSMLNRRSREDRNSRHAKQTLHASETTDTSPVQEPKQFIEPEVQINGASGTTVSIDDFSTSSNLDAFGFDDSIFEF